jgi:hypothetical protein
MTDWTMADSQVMERRMVSTIIDTRPVYIPREQIIRTPKCGGRGQLGTSSSTLYTAPSDTSPTGSTQGALLKSIVLCNTDSSARTVTLYLVESGGSAADNRAIFKDLSIAAKTTTVLTFPDDCCMLDSGETVRGLADSASVVTYRINVVEVTH